MAADYETVSEIFKSGDGVVVAEYDADAHREFANKFGIRGFPTLKWFPKGTHLPLSARTRMYWPRTRARVTFLCPCPLQAPLSLWTTRVAVVWMTSCHTSTRRLA